MLLNTCLSDEDEEIINESCSIVQHISSIPKVFNYQENEKIKYINKELPFEFLANDVEQLYFDNIINIMMNSLGNVKNKYYIHIHILIKKNGYNFKINTFFFFNKIEGYEKLNQDNEPNEVMEEVFIMNNLYVYYISININITLLLFYNYY